jgi:hypothetical protein
LPDGQAGLPHLWVTERAHDRSFHRTGGGDPKVREVERRAHGRARRQELDDAIDEQLARRGEIAESLLEELRALGVIIVLEGAGPAFPLKVDSLERMSTHRPRRPLWRLLSVTEARDDRPEQAMVWVSDKYREGFLKLFEQYLTEDTPTGNARNRELVANIARIRSAVLDDLWQSDGEPPTTGVWWWELWFAPDEAGLERWHAFAADRNLRVARRTVRLVDRYIVWVEARWDDLAPLPFTSVPLTELRRPELADTIEDLSQDDQEELTGDLASRLRPAASSAPAVCHLDTGVRRSHLLVVDSLDDADVHSIVDADGVDNKNHGTPMASLSLFGPLDELLLGSGVVALRHRLESVKMLPDGPAGGHDPSVYGVVTAQAVALPENRATRVVPATPCPFHGGIAAPHLLAPLLMMIAPGDEMPAANPAVSRAAFASVPGPKEVVEIEGGHFGLLHHPSALFDQASSAQTDFLRRTLSAPSATEQ